MGHSYNLGVLFKFSMAMEQKPIFKNLFYFALNLLVETYDTRKFERALDIWFELNLIMSSLELYMADSISE